MSYILEALKKSEQERRIGHVPDLSMAQETPLHAAPRWPRWLLAALLLNALLLVFLGWRVWDARMSAGKEAAQPAAVVPAPTAPPVRPSAAAPGEAVTIPAADLPVETDAATPVLPEPVSQTPPATPSVDVPASELPADADTGTQPQLGPDLVPLPAMAETGMEHTGMEDAVPRWEDLPDAERAGLPVPRIDVHVFAEEPERRFVLINLRKYLQGDTLDNGAVIETILADGIVLSYQGQQYRVDRP